MNIAFWIFLWLLHDTMAEEPAPAPEIPAETPTETPAAPAPPASGGGTIINMSKKPVMCEYAAGVEPAFELKSLIPYLDPECIPTQCEVILYHEFCITNTSEIKCDTELLKKLTKVRPVIISILRPRQYTDWTTILTPEGNAKDTKVLIDFAKANNVSGYRLQDLTPSEYEEVLDVNVAVNVVPYMRQLKEAGLIVGAVIVPFGPILNNKCVTDFEAMNEVVDFYEIFTFNLNGCVVRLYNGMSPIKLTPHGQGYVLSMEEVWKFIEASKCNLEKIYLTIELYIIDNLTNRYYISYSEVCTGYASNDICIPDTKQLFDKGNFVKLHRAGLLIRYLNVDDFEGTCGCGPFIGLRNILNGYHSKELILCEKFDVQKGPA